MRDGDCLLTQGEGNPGGLQDCCKGRLKRTDTEWTMGKGLKTETELCMLQGNGKIGAEALSPPSLC